MHARPRYGSDLSSVQVLDIATKYFRKFGRTPSKSQIKLMLFYADKSRQDNNGITKQEAANIAENSYKGLLPEPTLDDILGLKGNK